MLRYISHLKDGSFALPVFFCKSPINACSLNCEYIISPDAPFPNYHRQAKQLTDAKKQYPQLKTVHSQVLQQTLRTLDRAWDDMRARGFGFPRFKNKYRLRSFVFPQLGKDPIRNDALNPDSALQKVALNTTSLGFNN